MVWAIDPTISGPATVLIEANERRVVAWLNNRFDLDLDAVQPHGRPFKLWQETSSSAAPSSAFAASSRRRKSRAALASRRRVTPPFNSPSDVGCCEISA
jgi:hypothetical protein